MNIDAFDMTAVDPCELSLDDTLPAESSGKGHACETRLMTDAELRDMLEGLTPSARSVIRQAARANLPERKALAQRLLSEPKGQNLADFVDLLDVAAGFRRQVIRVLGWMEAEGA